MKKIVLIILSLVTYSSSVLASQIVGPEVVKEVCNKHYSSKMYTKCISTVEKYKEFDFNAVKLCMRFTDALSLNKCLDEIGDASFHSKALSECHRMPNIQKGMYCVRVIKNANLNDRDVNYCSNFSIEAYEINKCFRRIGGNDIWMWW